MAVILYFTLLTDNFHTFHTNSIEINNGFFYCAEKVYGNYALLDHDYTVFSSVGELLRT